MKKRNLFSREIWGALLLLFSFWGEEFFAFSQSFGIQKILIKKEAPLFSLKDLNGKEISLSEFRGKPILLFFWGSFCPSCKEDIVLLQKFASQNEGRLVFLTIAIDGEKEKKVRKVAKHLNITLPILLDSKEKIGRLYGVKMIPTAFLIDREGMLKGIMVGQRDWGEPHTFSEIKSILNLN